MLKSIFRLSLADSILKRNILPCQYEYNIFRFKKTHIIEHTTEDVRITLIKDDDISILNLSEAEDICKEQKMKLIKITNLDVKTRRPVYKMMTVDQYHEEQLKIHKEKKEAKKEFTVKSLKVVEISNHIAKHDLETRFKNISKHLDKHHEVKIIIFPVDDNAEASEKIFQSIEKLFIQRCKLRQKTQNKATIKFHLVPLSTVNTEDISNITQQKREMHTDNSKNNDKL